MGSSKNLKYEKGGIALIAIDNLAYDIHDRIDCMLHIEGILKNNINYD